MSSSDLSAADVPDAYKSQRYWDLMTDISAANKAGDGARERRLIRAVQTELRAGYSRWKSGNPPRV